MVALVSVRGARASISSILKLKRLETQRRAARQPKSEEELELDSKIRSWPRTPESDPYQAGLEALGTPMKPLVINPAT
jgi:sirohydrochlorin cobaltochelatase